MKDLDLIPTEALLEELKDRFIAFSFAGIRHPVKTDEKVEYIFRWNGLECTLKGLVDMLGDAIIEDYLPLLDPEEDDG